MSPLAVSDSAVCVCQMIVAVDRDASVLAIAMQLDLRHSAARFALSGSLAEPLGNTGSARDIRAIL